MRGGEKGRMRERTTGCDGGERKGGEGEREERKQITVPLPLPSLLSQSDPTYEEWEQEEPSRGWGE